MELSKLERFVGIEIEAYVDTNLTDEIIRGWDCVEDGSLHDDDGECEVCEGHGYVNCDECSGSHEIPCGDCEDGYNECTHCDGSGYMEEDEDGNAECCDECGGGGTIECCECRGHGYVDCDNCDSDGEVRCECDGNYSGGRYGVEFVSPVMKANESFSKIDSIFEKLHYHEFSTDSTCGLHIHVCANDLKLDHLRNLLFLMQGVEPMIYGINPNNRYEGSYSKPYSWVYSDFIYRHGSVKGYDFLTNGLHGDECEEQHKYHSSRYYGINLHSYYYRKTIEFRYFEGAKSEDMVKYYTELCAKLVEFSKHATFEMLIPIVAQFKATDCIESLKVMVEELLEMETTYNNYSLNRYAFNQSRRRIEQANVNACGSNQIALAV
jgi:hypothetical protein